jgi:PAS domain S-box-containing protein
MDAFAKPYAGEYQHEYRIVRPDGSIRWMRSRSFPIPHLLGESLCGLGVDAQGECCQTTQLNPPLLATLSEDITEHKQAEQIRHQREQEFRALVENSPDPICRVDRQLRYVYVNPAVELATGTPAQVFLGKTDRELGMPDAIACLWEQSLEKVFQTGEEDENEFTFLTPDGPKYYQSRVVPELGADGSIESILVISRDLTKNKQIEEALRESEQRFRTVFESAPIGIAIAHPTGVWLQTNRAVQEILGYTQEELQNRAFIEFTHPDDRLESWKSLQDLVAGRRTYISLEKRYFRKDGRLIWVNLSATAVCDTNGLPQYAIAMLQDISEHKQTQLDLQKARDELEERVAERTAELVEVNTRLRQEIAERQQAQEARHESEQRYRLLIERMNEGVVIVDEKGWLLYINEKYGQMLGYSPSDMIGHHTSEFMDEANLKIVQDQIARRKSGENGSYELELRRKNGQRLFVILSASPILRTDGSFEGSFVVATDITALKAVESELQQAKEQLRAVLDAVPGFVSWISSEGRYLGVNQHLANAFNLPPDAFVGRELGFLQNSPNFAQFMEQFLATPTLTEQQIVEVQVNDSTRNYLIAAQKYNQSTAAVTVGIDITEHKQAEEALKKSHKFLQTVLDTNPNSIFVKDTEGKYVLANQACANSHGTTVEDLLGKTDTQSHLHPANVERFITTDQDVFTTLQEKFIPEKPIYTPTGELRWCQVIKKPIFASDGQLHYIFGVCTDITERKQVEEQLRHRETQLRLALEAARMGFWDWNLETGEVVWSNHLEQLYGMPVNTYDGSYKTFLASVHPEDRDRVYQANQASIEMGEDYDVEFRIVLPDGSIRWIGTKGQVFNDETGKPARMTGINVDITRRKQAEEKLRHNEAQLHLALEAAQMGFWDWDIQTGKVIRSKHLDRLYGWPANACNDSHAAFLAIVHPEDRDRLNQNNQHCFDMGEDCDMEFRIVLPDGSIRWMESKCQVFRDETGKAVRMAGINLDITERKQAEIQVKQSLREKEVLLQEIHHRVKNNLQVISSLLDLQSDHSQEPATRSMFQESQNRVKSMALVHEKLYQSKDFARINAAEYIENLTSDLFQSYGVKADKITLELDLDDITLSVDTTIPCGLIISELVSNALKYAFPNRENGVIQISLHSDIHKNLTLIVRDNGVGFPGNWDFKGVKSLGLQLVNVLTSQLDGTLELDRSIGTEFRIRFSELG